MSRRTVQEFYTQSSGDSQCTVKETRTIVTTTGTGKQENRQTVTTRQVYSDGSNVGEFKQTVSHSSQVHDISKQFEAISFPKDEEKKKPGFFSKGFSALKPRKTETSASAAPATNIPKNAAEFEKQTLEAHNNYRAKHGVPPLKLSAELTKYATEWVTKLAREDSFQHRPNNKYGENIFMKWNSDPNYDITGSDPVESWYSEIKDHRFGVEPRSLASGHFTQVVWQGSKELGIAKAKSASGKILVVANYNPAGNMIGDFARNVPPPKK